MAGSRIAELASLIAKSTTYIDTHLAAEGHPTPSFDADQPTHLLNDSKLTASRRNIIEATDELHALMLGPVGILTSPSHNFMISLQAIYRLGLATGFPRKKSEATFGEIALYSGVCESHVRRILRHAMTYRIFCEPRKGVVAHTAASKMLAENPLMHEWIGMVSEEMWPAATRAVDALTRWPNSEEPYHSGFNIAHNTDKSVFDELAKYPDREKRYAAAMTWFSTAPGLESSHIVDGFAWESIGKGVIVDVGGSQGSVGAAIVRAFPSLHCIVQDQADVVKVGQQNLPPELKTRITFMKHDFFEEQPIKAANVYLLRWILHDWSDKYAVQILKALVPALTQDSKVVICEHVLPEPGIVPICQERAMRGLDLAMLEFHNAKERDIDDWIGLLAMADPRFRLLNSKQPPSSRLAVMEVGWLGDKVEDRFGCR